MAAPEVDLERPPTTVAWNALERSVEALANNLKVTTAERPWADALYETIEDLDEIMAEHQRLSEEPGGSFDDIVQRHHALEPRVEEQRCDHADIRKRAARLMSVIEKGRAFDIIDSDRLCLEGRILHDLVKLHMMLETELIQEAYNTVEGGEEGRG